MVLDAVFRSAWGFEVPAGDVESDCRPFIAAITV